jgi:hypothetical protein
MCRVESSKAAIDQSVLSMDVERFVDFLLLQGVALPQHLRQQAAGLDLSSGEKKLTPDGW